MQGIESLCQYLIKGKQCLWIVPCKKILHKGETVFIIQNVQVADYILIFDICTAESNCLVEYGKGIPHRAICLVGNNMQGFVIYGNVFL